MGSLAETLRPPYYAAVVTPVGGDIDLPGRLAMDELISLAPRLDGFLGLETGRLDDGRGAAVCYWKTPAAIQSWKTRVLAQMVEEVSLQSQSQTGYKVFTGISQSTMCFLALSQRRFAAARLKNIMS